jgi:CBS domain-containing protein
MKVRDAMTKRVGTCSPGSDLAEAAMVMWRQDCGIVPVIQENGREAIGVITDRDICMAVATRHRRAEEIRVDEVMCRRLFKVTPDDDLKTALATMRRERVRRLLVVDPHGRIEGMLSLSDIARAAARTPKHGQTGLTAEEVLSTYRAICTPAAQPPLVPPELIPQF